MADFNPSGVWGAQLIVGTQVTFNIGPVQPNGSFSGSANGVLGTGQGSGWALGRLFVFKVDWPDQSASLYSGWLDGDRTIRGSVMGRVGAPTTSIGWGSLKHSDCSGESQQTSCLIADLAAYPPAQHP